MYIRSHYYINIIYKRIVRLYAASHLLPEPKTSSQTHWFQEPYKPSARIPFPVASPTRAKAKLALKRVQPSSLNQPTQT